jgi:hypothetical protein
LAESLTGAAFAFRSITNANDEDGRQPARVHLQIERCLRHDPEHSIAIKHEYDRKRSIRRHQHWRRHYVDDEGLVDVPRRKAEALRASDRRGAEFLKGSIAPRRLAVSHLIRSLFP